MTRVRVGTWLLTAILSLSACSKPRSEAPAEAQPAVAAEADTTKTTSAALVAAPAAAKPDYADPKSWLCRPGREDACSVDLTSTVIQPNGKMRLETWAANPSAKVDCFYVYPTVSLDGTANSDMLAGDEERAVIRSQAARFGSQCRVFAPIYRQVTLTALRAQNTGKPMTPDRALGYGDVADAWKHYLEHDNAGRGVVLIGHSQGSGMLLQLLQKEIDGKPIQKQLVSALLIGTGVTVAKGKDVGGSFQHVPLCNSPRQLGCVVAYASFRANSPPTANARAVKAVDPGQVTACTNPAALAGGRGSLHAYLSSGRVLSSRDPEPWVKSGAPVNTAFVSVPGLLSAECKQGEYGSYLAVTVHGKPGDPRVDDIVGDVVIDGKVDPNRGLHVIDMHLAMGNLVDLVGAQSRRYLAL